MTFDTNRVVALVVKVQGDFLEAPALKLTLGEAEERFGVDRHTCQAILGTLVNSGVLAPTDDGAYVRFFPRLAHAA